MANRDGLRSYRTTNAALGWGVVALVALAGIHRALQGELLWAGLAAMVVAISVVPPVASRHPEVMIAWEVIALAGVPIIARTMGVLVEQTAYAAVAALALVVAVELDAYTGIDMTPGFAVAFVVIVTMATAGIWAIARYVSDVVTGSTMLGGQTALMWDLVIATVIGTVAGVLFELYVRRLSPGHRLYRDGWG